ncbi:hypothetical protein ACH5RR_030266 [Cinchona calisaya]|uniref:Coiled-coil domain-containing protein 130 n=1 Tax=Cinchona calisaya TaxID=153742 RepID=A0ABD2YXT2_9GENT
MVQRVWTRRDKAFFSTIPGIDFIGAELTGRRMDIRYLGWESKVEVLIGPVVAICIGNQKVQALVATDASTAEMQIVGTNTEVHLFTLTTEKILEEIAESSNDCAKSTAVSTGMKRNLTFADTNLSVITQSEAAAKVPVTLSKPRLFLKILLTKATNQKFLNIDSNFDESTLPFQLNFDSAQKVHVEPQEGVTSSLAAARADNFYYPPEWTPKKGSLNKFHGQHALRERARKLDQGILIIRFEMPFNIWCGGCESMIAKGVRFNAEKKQVGNYYSTKIWSFSMKSACCKHEIVIQTDPKNCEYVIISGALKKTEEFDVEDAETMLLPVDEERSKLADPFYRLEHQEKDIKKKKEAEPVLVRLQRVSDSRHSDDYGLNKALRAKLRNQKKRVAEEEAASRKMGLGIRLLPASEEDTATARRIKFAQKFEKNRKDKRALINAASIFSGSSGSSSSKRRVELESKRRKINATVATNLLVGGFKPSSWSK